MDMDIAYPASDDPRDVAAAERSASLMAFSSAAAALAACGGGGGSDTPAPAAPTGSVSGA